MDTGSDMHSRNADPGISGSAAADAAAVPGSAVTGAAGLGAAGKTAPGRKAGRSGAVRVAGAVLHLLWLLLLAGAWAVDYFARTRMGMARHLVFLRSEWYGAAPVDGLRIAGMVLAAVLMLTLLFVAAASSSKLRCAAGAGSAAGSSQSRPPVSALLCSVLALATGIFFVLYTATAQPYSVRAAIAVTPLTGLAFCVAWVHALALWRHHLRRCGPVQVPATPNISLSTPAPMPMSTPATPDAGGTTDPATIHTVKGDVMAQETTHTPKSPRAAVPQGAATLVTIAYVSLVWALTAGLWLGALPAVAHMAGWISLAVLVLLVVVGVVLMRKNIWAPSWRTALASLIVAICLLLMVYEPAAALAAPAQYLGSFAGGSAVPQAVGLAGLGIVAVAGLAVVLCLDLGRERTSGYAARRGQSKRVHSAVRWATFLVAVAIFLAFELIPPLRSWIGQVFAALSSGDIERVVELIRSYGPWAAAVSFVLMILQSVAAPIPAFLITFSNAAVFGWWQGAILSWTSAMAGAAVCFFLARNLGRDAVGALTSHGALASVDRFFEHYGKNAILICRLLPFMSFDLVSYAAGLTKMGFAGFMLATGVGQLPATLVYSYVGGMLTGSVRTVVTALFIIFALAALAFLIKTVYSNRNKVLMAESEEASRQAEAQAAAREGIEVQ